MPISRRTAAGHPRLLGYENFTGSNLSKYASALAQVQAGVRNAKVLFLGDSSFLGEGSAPSQPTNDTAYATVSQLPKFVHNASWSSWFGDQNTGTVSYTLPLVDSRVTFTGSTQGNLSTALNSLGGELIYMPGTGAALTFTPTNSVDSFDFYYYGNGSNGDCTIQIGAGTPQTVVTGGKGNGMYKATITGTLGANTLTVAWLSGGPVYVNGVVAYNSAIKEVSCILGAGYEWGASNWTNNSGSAWDPMPTLQTFAPDLTFLTLNIIDEVGGTSLATYAGYLQTIITAAKLSGDVIMSVGTPISTESGDVQATYVGVCRAVAQANNIPFIDIYTLFGANWTNASNAGLMWDTEHPTAHGCSVRAQMLSLPLLNPKMVSR